MNNFWLVGWIVAFLYLFLETDAVPYWGSVLGLNFLRYDRYKEQSKLFGPSLKYRQFIIGQYQNFFVYLFTCQECLGTWLTIVGFVLFSRYLGGWQTFGVTLISVIVGIALMKFILKKLYE